MLQEIIVRQDIFDKVMNHKFNNFFNMACINSINLSNIRHYIKNNSINRELKMIYSGYLVNINNMIFKIKYIQTGILNNLNKDYMKDL